jgi:hypothetical protein
VTGARPAGPTLADVAASAAAAVGVDAFSDALGIGDCRHAVVCLIDGLGWLSLQEHRAVAPRLAALAGGPIASVFPTTTPVGLGSFGTGLLPGMHGLVGAAFEYPETGELLSPLQWGSHPTPVAVQPEPTVFERAAAAGVRVTTTSPGAYRDSGLTRAVLRGADYAPAEGLDDRLAAVETVEAAVSAGTGRALTYVYWPELDRVGHESGVGSEAWLAALARVDVLVGRLVDALGSGSALVVTADHGMVDCPVDVRIDIDADGRLTHGVRRIAGEPRARHVYVQPGAAPDVAATWGEVLGERALVLTRAELIAAGYLGDVDPALEERIGDVMAIPRASWMLASSVDPTVSRLIGQHGGLTDQEVLIPALLHRAT